jgi:hypothetical protein
MTMLSPLFMDINEVYSGDELGLPYRDLIGEGVVASAGGDLLVTAGAGNSVNIAAGSCWVVGDTNLTRQPTYRCLNDATANLGISPDPSNPRKVLVVVQVTDEAFTGTGRNAVLTAIHGTPAASPSLPALPASAMPLSEITVPAAAASSAAYTFLDARPQAKVGEGSLPLSPAASGVTIYRKTTDKDIVNTASETDLLNGEITIAAGVMGTDKLMKVFILGDFLNNTGGNVSGTWKVKLGGTVIWEDAHSSVNSSATRRAFRIDLLFGNKGAANVNFLVGALIGSKVAAAATTGLGDMSAFLADGAGGTAFYEPIASNGNTAIDTSAAKLLEVTYTPGSAQSTHSVRLKYCKVEIG